MYHSIPGSMHSISWRLPSVLKVILHMLVVSELLIFIMLKIYTEYVLCLAAKLRLIDPHTVVQTHQLHIPTINRVLECHRVHY